MATEQKMIPSQSLYLQNLPDKLQKEDLRRQLYMLFSTYGPVLDITAMKTPRMRGQAHVLFRDVQAASQAMRGCQGFDFFGKEMKIQYAKSRSKTLAKMSGVFDDPKKVASDQQAQTQAPNTFPSAASAGVAPVKVASEAPGTSVAPSGRLPPPSTLPAPPTSLPGLPSKNLAPATTSNNAPSPQGVKRPREDSDEEAPIDEDDDDGEGEMDMSDDDD